MILKPTCPSCGSKDIAKHARSHHGQQNFKCKACSRQFVEELQNKQIAQTTEDSIDKLLREKMSLAGIARVCELFESWLQDYVNCKYEAVLRQVSGLKKGRLTIQCDELRSSVGNQGEKRWIWLALHVNTREIVGVHVGARSKQGAQALWDSLPAVNRDCAVAYTDFWHAYALVLPQKRHKAVGKDTGKTSYIQCFNRTMRQRVSRLAHQTLSFSEKIENHVGSIWLATIATHPYLDRATPDSTKWRRHCLQI